VIKPDRGLEPRIHNGRRLRAPDRAVECKGAKRQSAEKSGDPAQHGHHFGPEGETQLAHPDDLVAEARKARRRDDRHQRPAMHDPPARPHRWHRLNPNRGRRLVSRSHRAAVRIALHDDRPWLECNGVDAASSAFISCRQASSGASSGASADRRSRPDCCLARSFYVGFAQDL
jgi:hypothetical protein